MPRKHPTPAERKDFEQFARSALGVRAVPVKPTTKPPTMKDAVKRVFKQEGKP